MNVEDKWHRKRHLGNIFFAYGKNYILEICCQRWKGMGLILPRWLSYRFHGKAPGKNKDERRTRKISDEKWCPPLDCSEALEVQDVKARLPLSTPFEVFKEDLRMKPLFGSCLMRRFCSYLWFWLQRSTFWKYLLGGLQVGRVLNTKLLVVDLIGRVLE